MIPPDDLARVQRVFAGQYVRFPDTYVVPSTTPPDAREVMLYARALSASRNPSVVALAVRIRDRAAGRIGRPLVPVELVQAVTDAGHELMVYTPDPPGVEIFNAVEWTLWNAAGKRISPITSAAMGTGDCEDIADTTCALGIANGLDMRPKWWNQPGAPQNHVGGTWRNAGAIISVETTLPGAWVGETPEQAAFRLGPGAMDKVYGVAI